MKEQIFKTENGDSHLIDIAGNHFINGRCVNPTFHNMVEDEDGVYVEASIGDTYPDTDDRRPVASGLKGEFEVFKQATL